MAIINFPSSPTNNQVFTDGDHTWVFSAVSAGGTGFASTTTATESRFSQTTGAAQSLTFDADF